MKVHWKYFNSFTMIGYTEKELGTRLLRFYQAQGFVRSITKLSS